MFFYRKRHPWSVAQEKHYKIRSGARASTKAQERMLIDKAEKLLKHPELAIPECEGSCWFCDFKSGLKKMESIRSVAEDEKKLERLTESGNDWGKAFAALLLLRKQKKIPYLFSAKTPFGEIAYAVRGSARKELLIGMQYYDHPRVRLVAVMDAVRNKKIHIFSFDDRMVCTGKIAAPPKDFIDFLVKQLGTELEKSGKAYVCRHLVDIKTEEGMVPVSYIEIDWKPAGTCFRICEKCVKAGKNTLLSILTHMAVPNPRLEFSFDAKGGFECHSKCTSCRIPKTVLDAKSSEKYLHGELDDRGLIDKLTMQCLRELKDGTAKVYVLGKKCFGKDSKGFLEGLKPSEEERIGLEAVLEALKGPVIIEGETAVKVLETYWDEHGERAMEAVCGDIEVARELLERYKNSKMSPSQLLKEAIAVVKQKEIIAKLPTYAKLPAVAKFADEMARIFFTRGKEDTARAIEKYFSEDASVKATAYAMLLAMGLQASKQWQYMETEREFAEYLKPTAEKFLASTPENYHECLQALLSATGSTERILEPKK